MRREMKTIVQCRSPGVEALTGKADVRRDIAADSEVLTVITPGTEERDVDFAARPAALFGRRG
jgi:hypothetical protein